MKFTFYFFIVLNLMLITFSENTVNAENNQSLKPTKSTVMVPMRDGTKLATDIYKPLLGKPWPALLIRTPYGKNGFSLGFEGIELTELFPTIMGCVVIIQDTRGRHDSEGVDSIFLDNGWGNRQDGYDAIEWMAVQDWCDGNVGILGPSAMGINAYLAAGAAPPHLKCLIAIVAASDLYHQAAYWNGCYRNSLVDGWIRSLNADYMFDFVQKHPTCDDMWNDNNYENRLSLFSLPGLHLGGWYDCFSQGNLNAFMMSRNSGDQYLIMGPWSHTKTMTDLKVGELDYPNVKSVEKLETLLGFIEKYLKNRNNALKNTAQVQYYLMGTDNEDANHWKEADTWPPIDNSLEFYVRDEGELSFHPPQKEANLTLYSNPSQPVPTIGGNNLNLDAGPYDQSSLLEMDGVVFIQSSPLSRSIEIAGPVSLQVCFETDLPDFDLAARLVDVYPDGKAMLICDGIAKARYRRGTSEEVFVESGVRDSLSVDLWSTAYCFSKGHRVGLVLSGSNYPRFAVNSQTDAPVFDASAASRDGYIHLFSSPNSPAVLSFKGKELDDTSLDEIRKIEDTVDFILSQNYPNPFDDKTLIPFYVKNINQFTLKIYDIMGREVMDLSHRLRPGVRTILFEPREMASGTYEAVLRNKRTGKYRSVKMTFIK